MLGRAAGAPLFSARPAGCCRPTGTWGSTRSTMATRRSSTPSASAWMGGGCAPPARACTACSATDITPRWSWPAALLQRCRPAWLIREAVSWERCHGFTRLSLTFSPFAGLLATKAELPARQRLERRALLRLKGVLALQLDNLLRFNEQFDPDWLPRYVILQSWADLPRVAVAATAAEGYLPHASLIRGERHATPTGPRMRQAPGNRKPFECSAGRDPVVKPRRPAARPAMPGHRVPARGTEGHHVRTPPEPR